jgi:hypothetical protein
MYAQKEKTTYRVQYSGLEAFYDDEQKVTKEFVSNAMEKISAMSKYTDLHVNIKPIGNTEGNHIKKYEITMQLRHGNHVLTASKQTLDGTNDEEHQDDVKGSRNALKLVQKLLQTLTKLVKDEHAKMKH